MPKNTSARIPNDAVVIRTYDRFRSEIDAFAHNERSLLVIVGPPGTAKSTVVRNALPNARVIEGGSTPYRLYQELFKNIDMPIVLDDADRVFRDRQGVFLLKTLAQTEPRKRVTWHSATPEIRAGELPSEFWTTSRTLIVANSWPSDNADMAAVESRGHIIYFCPTLKEIHTYAKAFCSDAEVYDYVGEHIELFDNLDLRIFWKAAEVKVTGKRTGDKNAWREYIDRQMMGVEKRIVAGLLKDGKLRSNLAKAKEFERITGMSQATFYRYVAELKSKRGDE
jgi:hypothetical protein